MVITWSFVVPYCITSMASLTLDQLFVNVVCKELSSTGHFSRVVSEVSLELEIGLRTKRLHNLTKCVYTNDLAGEFWRAAFVWATVEWTSRRCEAQVLLKTGHNTPFPKLWLA